MIRVGVIGGGQLAWMMGAAAEVLGIELHIQTPHQTDPAVDLVPSEHIVLAPVDDARATAVLAQGCDVVTFENEFVDLDALGTLFLAGETFYPAIASLRPLLDKYYQRQCFQRLNIPTPIFRVLESGEHCLGLEATLAHLCATQPNDDHKQPHFPVVLKARRHGYDGKGTYIVESLEGLRQILTSSIGTPWLLEEFIPFEKELAVMAARSQSGDIVIYPVVESEQANQVCRRVFILPHVDLSIQEQVKAIVHKLLTHLNFVGVLGIEFFLTTDGGVLVNEVAPRTHNSGHYTIDACVTSQFEQQLRAIAGLPLGDPTLTCAAAVMVNLLGYESSDSPEIDYRQKREEIAALPHTQVYWYGKVAGRPGRKMGHVTAILPSLSSPSKSPPNTQSLRARLEAIATTIENIWYRSPET